MYPEPNRVVQLFAEDDADGRVGSGYLLLAAAHVVPGSGRLRVVIGSLQPSSAT